MGEEHHRLVDLGFAPGVDLVDHHRQADGDEGAKNNKQGIVQQGIAKQH